MCMLTSHGKLDKDEYERETRCDDRIVFRMAFCALARVKLLIFEHIVQIDKERESEPNAALISNEQNRFRTRFCLSFSFHFKNGTHAMHTATHWDK